MVLKSFRNASHSFAIKILFTAIILSFCLWGVGDIIRNYNASKAVFTVNNKRVTVEHFLRAFSHEKQQVQNMSSKPLSDEEISKLDIKGAVLDKLLNALVLECAYEKLGIIVPKKSLTELIYSLPQFQSNGGFDSRIYTQLLRRSGMTESGFLNDIKENIARTQLLHPIMAGYKTPTIIKNMLVNDFVAQRNIFVARFRINAVIGNEKYSDDELKQYYEENKEKYTVPETRDVSVMVIDYSKVAGTLTVDEEEVESVYQETKDLYIQAETRDVERYCFATASEAEKAWRLISKGTSKAEIEKLLSPKIHDLPKSQKRDYSMKIGSEIFKLMPGATTNVIQIGDKFYVYKLVHINKAKQKSTKQIKDEIREEMRNEKLNSPEFYNKKKEISNTIDDSLGAGSTLEQVANKTGMPIIRTSVTRNAIENGKLQTKIADEETRKQVVQAIFETDEGQVSTMIESPSDETKAYVVCVNKIRQKHEQQFEEIRTKIKRDYARYKGDNKIQAKLDEIKELEQGAIETLKERYKPKRYVLTKKEVYLSKVDSKLANLLKGKLTKEMLAQVVSNIKVGGIMYKKVSDDEYVVVGLESITESSRDESAEKLLNSYEHNANKSIIAEVAVSAFKSNQKIRIHKDLIDTITKERND